MTCLRGHILPEAVDLRHAFMLNIRLLLSYYDARYANDEKIQLSTNVELPHAKARECWREKAPVSVSGFT